MFLLQCSQPRLVCSRVLRQSTCSRATILQHRWRIRHIRRCMFTDCSGIVLRHRSAGDSFACFEGMTAVVAGFVGSREEIPAFSVQYPRSGSGWIAGSVFERGSISISNLLSTEYRPTMKEFASWRLVVITWSGKGKCRFARNSFPGVRVECTGDRKVATLPRKRQG